ncbi:response regulator transcription factor [Leisingera daeponensis]|uniref:response regulator transcription factor n=1 Tax=Leisingera daeponensis TaxID=405746 RepID=UPI001C98AF64|nr:response regulator transcription factor [Leisingera daeponensis]MBY6059734.1 response regulator transcription factor [Leisingera daeponensis]
MLLKDKQNGVEMRYGKKMAQARMQQKENMKILYVEGETPEQIGLTESLRDDGFTVNAAGSAEIALDFLGRQQADLVILTVNLPKTDGFRFLEQMRLFQITTPVLVLSESSEVSLKTRSFELGADDFVTKPFEFEELSARIRAIGRRVRGQAKTSISAGGFLLDRENRVMKTQGNRLVLTPTEYEFLELLFRHRGSLVPREMILNRLYAGKEEPKEKIIDVYAHRLRTKLKKAFGRSILLETVWGRGIVLKLTSRRNIDLLEQRSPQRVSGSNQLFFNDDLT